MYNLFDSDYNYDIILSMNKTIERETGNVYTIPIKSQRNKQTISERNNHSLPSITFDKNQKVNIIRRQIQESNHQITTMRARIAALKHYKQRTQSKKNKNLMQIHFLNTVRQRIHHDQQEKNIQKERKQRQLQELHKKASIMRQTMSKGLDMAKSTIKDEKYQLASNQRKKKQQDQQYLNQLKTYQLEQNRLKAKQVKRAQLSSLQKIKSFQQSRLTMARANYQERLVSSIRERNKAEKRLKRLKKEQDSIILDVKQIERQMRETENQLQQLNPEKHHKVFSSKVSELNLHDFA